MKISDIRKVFSSIFTDKKVEAQYKNNELAKTEEDKQKIRQIQSLYRSNKRKKLHNDLFQKNPIIVNYCDTNNERIINLITELSNQHAVISNEIYHWTVLSNFQKIIEAQHFYGNKILKKFNIPFFENALSDDDLKNGDGAVICFAPFFVDSLALTEKYQLRKDLLRLTVDINKIEPTKKYNQFFKIYDFLSPGFIIHYNVNENFSIDIHKHAGFYCRSDQFEITFRYQNNKEIISLSKADAIFYGDLVGINRFCLQQLIHLISKIKDESLKKNILSFIESLNDNDLKNLLVNFAKNLVTFSEYNFNATLKLTPNLITEIFFVNDNKILDLHGLSPDNYNLMLKQVKENDSNLKDELPSKPPIAKLNENYNLVIKHNSSGEENRKANFFIFSSNFAKIKPSPSPIERPSPKI